MYVLKRGIKKDPQRRWNLPDRIFFGYGACHILAGAFLERPPLAGFRAERIVPGEGFSGNHIYVTDGAVACDYHGYSSRDRLLDHHRKGWSGLHEGWNCTIERVDFHLLDTTELNRRKMLGPRPVPARSRRTRTPVHRAHGPRGSRGESTADGLGRRIPPEFKSAAPAD